MSEAGTIILGIDVSKWQSKIDWRKVVDGTDYKFAFIKATENVGHVDGRFAENWRGAREVGLLRGPYHFGRPDKISRRSTIESDAISEANHFHKVLTANGYLADDIHPVLDIETHGIGDRKSSEVIDWVRAFLSRIEVLTGRPCIIYTGKSTWMFKFRNSADFFDSPLWQADYRETFHPITGWRASFRQYTTEGRVPGIKTKRVDKNQFFGTRDDLISNFTLVKPWERLLAPRPATVWV
jgi:lysozyme